MWTVDASIGWALTTLLSAFVGSYLAGYLKTKGQNLATHEDIDKIVTQVKAVTEATKKIEAEISSDVWDKQKRWEMKREVLFEAAKRLGALEQALQNMISILVLNSRGMQDTTGALVAAQKCRETSQDLDVSRSFVAIVCSEDAKKAIDDFGLCAYLVMDKVRQDPTDYDKLYPQIAKTLFNARNAIRKELEVDV